MRWRFLVVLIIGGLLIVQFQNCSQVNGSMTADSPLHGVGPGNRISDDWRSEPLVFAYTNVEVAEHLDETRFYGLCLRQVQTMPLTWKLSEDGQAVTTGNSSCVHGNFQIELTDLQNLPCGSVHRLTVDDAALGATASMLLTRRCPAVHSQEESKAAFVKEYSIKMAVLPVSTCAMITVLSYRKSPYLWTYVRPAAHKDLLSLVTKHKIEKCTWI